jgi:hypothetical protein
VLLEVLVLLGAPPLPLELEEGVPLIVLIIPVNVILFGSGT